jgi:hypothetical protein
VVLGLLLLCQSGCLLVAAAGATGATVAYVRGDLETSLDAPPQKIADAAERAMKKLDLSVISKQAGNSEGQVVGRSSRDVKFTVAIKSEGQRLSTISIRAGVFGNDAMQDQLLREIRSELASTAAVEPY